MMYYRISKNEKKLFFGKKIAQVWAVTLTTWFLIAVRQEVKRIDNSVVVHALELAIKRDLKDRL